jgi:hypothetical protein
MIKVVACFKRNPELTRAEFSRYYFERHAALFREQTPPEVWDGIVHYAQNHALELGGARTELPYDCVTEIGFIDRSALERWNEWYFGPGGETLRDDELHFMDKTSRVIVVAEQRIPEPFPKAPAAR